MVSIRNNLLSLPIESAIGEYQKDFEILLGVLLWLRLVDHLSELASYLVIGSEDEALVEFTLAEYALCPYHLCLILIHYFYLYNNINSI